MYPGGVGGLSNSMTIVNICEEYVDACGIYDLTIHFGRSPLGESFPDAPRPTHRLIWMSRSRVVSTVSTFVENIMEHSE